MYRLYNASPVTDASPPVRSPLIHVVAFSHGTSTQASNSSISCSTSAHHFPLQGTTILVLTAVSQMHSILDGEQRLTAPELRVQSTAIDQLLVRALLDQMTISEHENDIRVKDRPQSMRDKDAGPRLFAKDTVDVAEEVLLRMRVQSRRL